MKRKSLLFISVLSLSAFLFSCHDKGDSTDYTDTNKWILSNLQTYYYWADNIPSKYNLALKPDTFFESLLYTTEDRFSWIEDDAQTLINSLNGVTKSCGFEMKLYLMQSGSTNIIGQVTYVAPNTPASKGGLVRGDLFTKVNGSTLTTSNYSTLLSSDNLALGLVTYDGTTTTARNTISMVAEQIEEDPVVLDTVYTIGSSTIGYFVYKNFISDPGDDTEKYDKEMEAAFGRFKAKGIDELILDFRFNTGGAITSAIKLASLVGKDVTTSDVFVHYQYNNLLNTELTKEYGADYFYEKFVSEANSVGSQISRVTILTSNWTASASELIINGLRPYMTVNLVGQTTYGKNVGSITIYDKTGKINWAMQPIILKLFNKLDQSDYTNGFSVDYTNYDNNRILYPLGDTRETMLNMALTNVYGLAVKKSALKQATVGNVISNSISKNKAFFSVGVNNKHNK
jgi:carboxyl-terminal processing protease